MLVTVVLLVFFKLCAAQDDDCGVVPITKWAGQASLRTEPLINPVDLVVIQHSVFGACVTDEDCEDAVRKIHSFHMKKKGFHDIGLSFLVGGNGKVYEGAGWSLVGAHTKGYNNRSIGISFLGDFRKTLPTPEALQATKDLIACGVTHNILSQKYRLVGQKQVGDTESPGAELQKEIETWSGWIERVPSAAGVILRANYKGAKSRNYITKLVARN